MPSHARRKHAPLAGSLVCGATPTAATTSITAHATRHTLLPPHAWQDGATPLFIAAENGHETVARLLLERGAAVNAAIKVVVVVVVEYGCLSCDGIGVVICL